MTTTMPDQPIVEEFRRAMHEAGIVTNSEIVADGRLHRFHVNDDRPGRMNGWYVLHADGVPAGTFGSWRLDLVRTWCGRDERTLTEAERIQLRRQTEQAEREREAERARFQGEAAQRANMIFEQTSQAPGDQPYLQRKAIKSFGLRIHKNRLVVPVQDVEGQLQSLQFIGADGEKRFLTGGRLHACAYVIGDLSSATTIALICEGYATGASLHEATALPVVVAFNAGNLVPVAKAWSAAHPHIRWIIAADDDRSTSGNPGQAKAAMAARAVGGVIVVPEFRDLEGPHSDFNDLAACEGLETVRARIEMAISNAGFGQSGDRASPSSQFHFKLVPFNKIELLTTGAYLVREIIPREGLTLVWGPPKCGKSFAIFDLSMHVALGWQYRGYKVAQGPVVYVACEGEQGLGARAAAFRQHYPGSRNGTVPFYLVTTRLDLINEQDQLISDIRAQIGATMPVVVTIDTLNRSLVGSENSDEDMSAYIKAADTIREAFRCAVVIIHHCGIEASRPRGHTSLLGALDAQIAVTRNEAGIVTMTVERMKDGPEGAVVASKLDQVVVGIDGEGNDITSCIVIDTEAPPPTAKVKGKKPMPEAYLQAYDDLADLINTLGQHVTASGISPTIRVVTIEAWKNRLKQRGLLEVTPKGRDWLYSVKRRLIGNGRIAINEPYVWIIPKR